MHPYGPPTADQCETWRDRICIAINDHRQRFNDAKPMAVTIPPEIARALEQVPTRMAFGSHLKELGFYDGVALKTEGWLWTMTQIDGKTVSI